MGLLKHLLFWPASGPLFLTRFVTDRLSGVVRDELTDDHRVKEQLMELQLRLELGDIDDEGYEHREAELMRQLRDVRAWRERFGMPTSGGLVRVQQDESGAEEEGDEAPRVAKPSEAEIGFELGFDDDE